MGTPGRNIDVDIDPPNSNPDTPLITPKKMPIPICFKRKRQPGPKGKDFYIHQCTGGSFSRVSEIRAWMNENPHHTGPDTPLGPDADQPTLNQMWARDKKSI